MDTIKNENFNSKKVQLLDIKEYEFLKSLVDKGLIEIKDGLETLFEQTIQKLKVDDVKVIKVKEIFKTTKRKYDMAILLSSSGFKLESIPVFCEMIKVSLEIFEILQDDDFDKEFIDYINQKDEHDSDYIVSNSKIFYNKIELLIKSLA